MSGGSWPCVVLLYAVDNARKSSYLSNLKQTERGEMERPGAEYHVHQTGWDHLTRLKVRLDVAFPRMLSSLSAAMGLPLHFR